jgi:putative ABC transport system ATP-binding protein
LDGPVIQVRGLSKAYPGAIVSPEVGRGAYALRDLDLDVARGEFVAVVGRSGSGKTTLLNVVGGLDRDYTGRVEVGGRDLATLDDRALSRMRNRTIGFVFQAFHLLPHQTVLENVMLPARFADAHDPAGAERRAREALERTGLAHKASSVPTRLSAGERQRVAIARAILNRPELLLCDEPTGNLDAETGQAVLGIFLDLCAHDGTTLLVATHEDRVSRAAGRRVVLEAGRRVDGAGEVGR